MAKVTGALQVCKPLQPPILVAQYGTASACVLTSGKWKKRVQNTAGTDMGAHCRLQPTKTPKGIKVSTGGTEVDSP